MSRVGWTVLVLVVFAWAQVGPLCTQVLGVEEPWFTKSWRMYTSRHDDACAVAWYRKVDGRLEPFDHLGEVYGALEAAPDGARHPTHERQLRAEARQACTRVGGDVRMDAWCGVHRDRGAWALVISTEEPLCRP